ncbi:MAG TPA: TylF/MycF/NovP-related O-methyltransferase [Pseudonocardiaceae bacterium]|jgi:hypothetical protein
MNRDLRRAAIEHAFRTSAAFVADSMPLARPFKTPAAVLNYALDLAPATGLVAEFGVYSGATLRMISARRPGAHGFDSFEGLPEDWRDSHRRSKFAVQHYPEVDQAQLHVGWFADTLPKFRASNDERAAFLHLDADLYSSTVTVLSELEDRIESGTVLLFDEYFNYPNWQYHEHRAFTEFLDRTGLGAEYVAYNSRGEQVAARIL